MHEVMVLVEKLARVLMSRGERMATAESCTGGLVAGALTELAGSSQWFEGSVVAYDNRVKTRLLGVSEDVLARHGAVSRECAEAMVHGVCGLFDVPVGVSLSGIAGPGGGSIEKPVGLVWVAWQRDGRVWSRDFVFAGNRRQIRWQAVQAALVELADA